MAYKNRLFTALCFAALTVSAAAVPTITNISPPGGCVQSIALREISGDGGTLVGEATCLGAVKWTPAGGLQQIPPADGYEAFGVNYDGTIFAGVSNTPGLGNGRRWLPGGAVNIINPLPGFTGPAVYHLSDNGQVATGNMYRDFPLGGPRAIRWDAANGITVDLGAAGAGSYSFAYCVSGDGTTIYGNIYTPIHYVTRWRVGFPVEYLPFPADAFNGFPSRCNPNGTIVVGFSDTPSGYLGWKWEADVGYTTMPTPFGGLPTRAVDLTNDSRAIVGVVGTQPAGTHQASFWTENFGWTNLNSWLAQEGIDLTGWNLQTVAGVSNDGQTLFGSGTYFDVETAWYVTGLFPLCGPRIFVQPQNTTKCAQGTVTLTALGIGPGGGLNVQDTYQWFRSYDPPQNFNIPVSNGPTGNGSTISGATTGTLKFTNVSLADGGFYWCNIVGGCAGRATLTAQLTVLPNISGNGGPIGTADLVILLGNFGTSVPPFTNGDINGDGFVGTADLTALLGQFGQSCP